MNNIRDYFEEYGVYNVIDIINNFKEYFGIDFTTLLKEFYNKNEEVISQKEVINYCKNNYSNLNESRIHKNINKNIIAKRIYDYNIYYKKINIYKNKGQQLLNILLYLQNNNNIKNEEYEKIIKELDINHYNNIIVGRDLIRILEALSNIINNYKENIKKINNYETYNIQNYDTFYSISRHAYPNESLINDEEEYDKTSIRRTRKMKHNLM